MKTIDVEGLPKPVAEAVARMVETLRKQWEGPREPRRRVELPIWPGKVYGRLTREEIYEDVV